MKSYKGNFRTSQVITASEDGKLPTEIQVLPVGEWNTLPYGLFKVTTEHLRQMIANFNMGTRKAVPVDVDHDGGKAAGWIDELFAKEDGLYAKVEWTPYGQELIEGKIYKLFSPEFSLNYVDPEYSTDHGAVFIAGSLTNRPLFKELSYITASEKPLADGSGVVLLFSQESMNIEELKAKNKEDLTQEELDFLKENEAQLSDEDKTKFGLVEAKTEGKTEEEESTEAKTEEKATEEEESADEKKEEATSDVKATEGEIVTITASELAQLKANAQEGIKAREELVAKQASELIGGFVCNDKGGKILPKDKDAFVDFYLKCSDQQKEDFVGLLKVLPETKVAGEVGKDSPALTAKEELEQSIQAEIKASEGKLQYGDGLKLVSKKNPELIKRYAEESKNQ